MIQQCNQINANRKCRRYHCTELRATGLTGCDAANLEMLNESQEPNVCMAPCISGYIRRMTDLKLDMKERQQSCEF